MAEAASPPAPNANGQPLPREAVEEGLVAVLTRGYRPTLPAWALWNDGTYAPPVYVLRDVDLMDLHPVCRSVMNYYKRAVHGAQFWGGESPDQNPAGLPICPESPEVEQFVREQCERYWSRGVPKVQGGYNYGWLGLENRYSAEDGLLRWEGCDDFSPRDTFLLTQDRRPVGVRVRNVQGERSAVDLWLSSPDVPAKALWYAHEPRYSSFYGQSQYLGGWRPWRRLAWKDGAETVLDTGCYRYGVPNVWVQYPDESYQSQSGTPFTTLDSQGKPIRYARDMARMIGEQLKFGAAVGTPSTPYPPDQGGGPKWNVTQLSFDLNVQMLLDYCKFLHDQISYGVGVPPELMQASETGSGYSGRSIPLEAFLAGQQRLADALLELFLVQVLRPLVRWNFGQVINGKVQAPRFTVKVKPLIMTKKEQSTPQAPQQQQAPPGGQQPGQGQETQWSPHVGEGGEQGWKSQGGEVRYQPNKPGSGQPGVALSADMTRAERVRRLARIALGVAA